MLPSAQPVTSEQGGHSPRVRAAESRAQAAHPSKHGSRGPLVTSLTAHRLCSLHPLFRRGGRHATEPMSCGHQAQGSRIQTTVVAPEPTSSLGPCFLTDKTRTEHRGRTGQAARSPQPPAAQSLPQPSSQGPGAGPLPVSCPSAAWGWAATGSYKAATPPGPLCSSCRDAAGLPTPSPGRPLSPGAARCGGAALLGAGAGGVTGPTVRASQACSQPGVCLPDPRLQKPLLPTAP